MYITNISNGKDSNYTYVDDGLYGVELDVVAIVSDDACNDCGNAGRDCSIKRSRDESLLDESLVLSYVISASNNLILYK